MSCKWKQNLHALKRGKTTHSTQDKSLKSWHSVKRSTCLQKTTKIRPIYLMNTKIYIKIHFIALKSSTQRKLEHITDRGYVIGGKIPADKSAYEGMTH